MQDAISNNEVYMRDAISKVEKQLFDLQQQDPAIALDGAVDIDRYLKAKPRILWILREANQVGNLWDLRKYFREELFSYNRWKSTAGVMTCVSHGLLNQRMQWGPWAQNENVRVIADCLRDVAVININKRGGLSRVDWGRLGSASSDFSDIIERQIEALQPDIIILGGTRDFLPDRLKNQLKHLDYSDHNSARIDNAIYIHAYHPNQSSITHEQYYESVCKVFGDL